MLSSMQIENVAVIQKANVHFEKGLNVLTGETGAGKSILIDSINAILGNRASKDLVRTGAAKAVIRAAFEDVPPAVLDSLEKAGYERSEALLLSREITAEGKSTCRQRRIVDLLHLIALQVDAALLFALVGDHGVQRFLDPHQFPIDGIVCLIFRAVLGVSVQNALMPGWIQQTHRVVLAIDVDKSAAKLPQDSGGGRHPVDAAGALALGGDLGRRRSPRCR